MSVDLGGTTTTAGEDGRPAGRLAGLFAPRSIALVGATDKSGWSVNTLANVRASGFPGEVHLVNPRGGTVHGEQAYRSLSDLPGPVDLKTLRHTNPPDSYFFVRSLQVRRRKVSPSGDGNACRSTTSIRYRRS